MPFDLVIDEHTADGQEARVSKTSVAGSWGAVAGTLRYFADRFGVSRAAIEGTTVSYDLVRANARLGPAKVVLNGGRKHQRLAVERRRIYFGFELEHEVEPLEGPVPEELRPAARDVLTDALLSGEVQHHDTNRLRRAVALLDELWRRSGGTLPEIAPDAVRRLIRTQLEPVRSWDSFQEARFHLDPAAHIDPATRERLEALPSMIPIRGDAAPIDYEVDGGEAFARVRLREGQAKRLRPEDLPQLDRPLRFAVQRGRHAPLLADTIPALQTLLKRPRPEWTEDSDDRREGAPRGRHKHHRRGRPGRHR